MAKIVKLAAILLMQIRWPKIKTQLWKSVTRIMHTLFLSRRMCALCIYIMMNVGNIVELGNQANRIQHILGRVHTGSGSVPDSSELNASGRLRDRL